MEPVTGPVGHCFEQLYYLRTGSWHLPVDFSQAFGNAWRATMEDGQFVPWKTAFNVDESSERIFCQTSVLMVLRMMCPVARHCKPFNQRCGTRVFLCMMVVVCSCHETLGGMAEPSGQHERNAKMPTDFEVVSATLGLSN